MLDKQQLHRLVDQLPESDRRHEAPVDREMLLRIDQARAHPSPGIAHDDVLREFGL